MKGNRIILIPAVKKLRFTEGTCTLAVPAAVHTDGGAGELTAALVRNVQKDSHTGHRTNWSATSTAPVTLRIVASGKHREAYHLSINREGVVVTGQTDAGLFYGVQTLVQIIRQFGGELPCLEIDDAPDFSKRGFYHDVTRGKVPKLSTLQLLVDKLASYKINQLQLYIEHAFAFSAVPEFRNAFDPLTADDISVLDQYCRERFIDLVPSMATFGHLYELLRIPRFEHLNELDVRASRLPRDLWDRMVHYTINPSHEESFPLIRSMLEEFSGLFSSQYVNICCDETFDLGRGKNRIIAENTGVNRLYIDFVKKLAEVVIGAGKTPMMWGDIMLRNPELLKELPRETVVLNWNYGADCTSWAVRRFRRAGVRQYVCPGVSGWNRFANDIKTASANIRRQVSFGKKYGAEGVLTTDWGDCGHVNFFASSIHGMALGAALSWNTASFPADTAFDAALSLHEWGDGSRQSYRHLRELGSLGDYHFGSIYAWVNYKQCEWNREKLAAGWSLKTLTEKYHRAGEIVRRLKSIAAKSAASGTDSAELLWGAKAIQWVLALLIGKNEYRSGTSAGSIMQPSELMRITGMLRDEFIDLWRQKNRESELRNVVAVFNAVIEKIAVWNSVDGIGGHKNPEE